MVRAIIPYVFEFKAYTKARWVGQTLLETMANEFKRRSLKYFDLAIRIGAIRVNGAKVDINYRLKHNDLITNLVHRHEPPIPDGNLVVVHENKDLLVVDKPAGVPCHPNSAYAKNSLTEIVREQMGLEFISAINRLDRQTSGLVILAKSERAAAEYHQTLMEGVVAKWYVCRVSGEFPEGPVIVDLPLVISREDCLTTIYTQNEQWIGRTSRTAFWRLAKEGQESVLLCRPVTGRTHQIRVHLQALGYPIANDQIYSQGYIPPQAIHSLLQPQPTQPNPTSTPPTPTPSQPKPIHITPELYFALGQQYGIAFTRTRAYSLFNSDDCRIDEFLDNNDLLEQCTATTPELFILEACMHCRHLAATQTLPRFSILYLHAMQYTIKDQTWTTNPPKWTNISLDAFEKAKEHLLIAISS
ncbi:hypothetical protein NEHOM01_2185 [Nematocida homosporus]|uniref:uncharacterized protein n=1 Tax=Nematocida homosporus TaxID=1912981 RepID=UPI00221FC199|nr:uncharacterized protein NEHOM01_2185 [Nematocida homosporus]KAI5187449.1 hypothetical protein NEHOM01_2185 [Nematocida homosporus]